MSQSNAPSDFNAATLAQWEKAAAKSAPGGDVGALNWVTPEGLTVKRYKKPTFTRPAPLELLQDIASNCDVVVEGLAD